MRWDGFPPDAGRTGIYILGNGANEMIFVWDHVIRAWIFMGNEDSDDPSEPIEPHEIAAADLRLIREA